MTWNWVDTLLVACLAWPLVSGLRDGLVAGLLKTACLLAGVLLGIPFAPHLATHLGLFLPATVRTVAAFLAILVAFWGLGRVTTWFWRTTLGFTPLGLVDRAMGVVLGLVKGILFALSMAVLLLFAFPSQSVHTSVRNSWLGGRIGHDRWASAMDWIASRLPR